tara:strand:- start:4344 stop:4514 length:171 start_codon:yes stop_codon:yes gene_type:complete
MANNYKGTKKKKTRQGTGTFSKKTSSGGETYSLNQSRGSRPNKFHRKKKPYRGQGR